MDNVSLKEIQNRLLQWESLENPLAPLTPSQREAIVDLEALITGTSKSDKDEPSPDQIDTGDDDLNAPILDNTYQFLDWYESLWQTNEKCKDAPYEAYYKHLEEKKDECGCLIDQIESTMSDLNKLSEQYNFVSDKTNALHTMSEQLLADQNKLSNIGDEIKQKLHYFTQVEHLSQRLNSPTMSVNSEAFFNVLAKIDECLEYMKTHDNYKESYTYLMKFRHLQSRAMSQVRSYVTNVLNHATEQVLAPHEDPAGESLDTAYAVYFGKFQAAAPRVRMVIGEIEKRADESEDYAALLADIQAEYTSRRARVAGAPTAAALRASARAARDHCAVLRAACSLLAHASRDERALYEHFFGRPSKALDEYLQSLCTGLYEAVRSRVIHVPHLETLAELCAVLRLEVLEEQVQHDPETLVGLGACARALLQDAQERLVFRAGEALRADVLGYRPAPQDLDYPQKLVLMEQIAQSLQEPPLRRSDSRSSVTSDASATSLEVAGLTERRPPPCPADLHGMWYPGVKRTLAALSRLYRCLEKRVFQGIAQEAISLCVQSINNAAKMISEKQTPVDGYLFQIKHLLIVREQIAPFQVDFVVKETTLDFSNMKTAAYGLMQRPRQLFSLTSNNALLEFLLEGTPLVREHLLDSRKEVDRQLKAGCEAFIKHATEVLVGPLIEFLEKAQQSPGPQAPQPPQTPAPAPARAAAAVTAAQRAARAALAPLQRSMQLYLANRETEFILFRPIRNNVVGYFMQLEQLQQSWGYSYEDTLIVACPTAEQVSVFLSSASLVSHSEPVLPYGQKRRTSTIVKPSVASLEETVESAEEAGIENV